MIKDLITFDDDDEKDFLELDNGYLIRETNYSMNGTGRAGINCITTYMHNEWGRSDYKRLSDKLN